MGTLKTGNALQEVCVCVCVCVRERERERERGREMEREREDIPLPVYRKTISTKYKLILGDPRFEKIPDGKPVRQ